LRRGLAAIAVTLASAACAVVGRIDPVNYRATTDADAETADTAAPAEDAGGDAGQTDANDSATNLLDNGSFERGCGEGWTTNDPFATITESTVAHGGARSCQICSSAFDAGASLYFFSILSQTAPGVVPAPGDQYEAAVWAQKAAAGGDFAQVAVNLAALGADGGVVEETTSVPTVAAPDWTRVSMLKTFNAGGTQLQFSVRLRRYSDQSACVLLDDAELFAR
jgi:hypothetical protein